MKTALWMKFVATILLIALWALLVFFRGADQQQLIFAIGQALVGLGVYHAAKNQPSSSSSLTNLITGIQSTIDPAVTSEEALSEAAAQTAPNAQPVAAAPVSPVAPAPVPAQALVVPPAAAAQPQQQATLQ
ncbi:hypothetical protein FAZ95_13715 [Trinickia violacea]|uniref:Uncharacterized protein n=1 Tax=Trinickia violacea TaxID=2571746 RepID=A0A4V1EHG0_9BURK|nr:hypothetical protein [Trinickia violacea]QCP50140.1 hypothetical protein FAZ95_13715 [Trinickia violacea]